MIEVFDYRSDVEENSIVRPELRARFLRLEPLPAQPQHSHELAGEVFLVMEGECEFFIGDESVICTAGQLIYVDRTIKHTFRALGTEPCVLYLSMTPHVEPTHTFYDADGRPNPSRYDAWRGHRHPDASSDPGRPDQSPDFADGTLSARYLQALERLAELSTAAAAQMADRREALDAAAAGTRLADAKKAVDELWPALREALVQVNEVEIAWNEMAPQTMPL
jgi:quercetin dioxygenase-like cupin family protein